MSALRFLCQCCHQPLRLIQSTDTLGCDTSQEPVASKLPSAQQEPGETPEQGSASRVQTDVGKLQDRASGGTLPGHGKMSWSSSSHFTLLGKLDSGRTLSSIQKATRGIFDTLAGEDLGHPLCEDCTDNLLEQLDTQLAISESDSQNYRCSLETREGSSGDEREALQEELKGLEMEEARLVQELEQVERTRARAAVALQAAQAETEMLGQQERQHHTDFSKSQWQQLELCDELGSLENQLRYAQTQLARLEKMDAFRSAFEIRHDGPLAIINNFRLGCLPTVPVSWEEINAAWGQTALLLLALSNTVGLQFQRYQLVPCGNHSYLKSLTGDGTKLPLFCSNWPCALLYNKFDRAMAAFLDCMQQFKEEAEKGEQGLRMPCRIHVGRGLIEAPGAGGELYSIRTHSNTEEHWTKALKLMLTNFKWTLVWVSLRYGQK
ncbi:beclin-2 [Saccopteryx leptura]|uniref:beclin-2 n=1 Tax=Saccopteryx leptura TaxID=249018 RepID=UPI00339BE338